VYAAFILKVYLARPATRIVRRVEAMTSQNVHGPFDGAFGFIEHVYCAAVWDKTNLNLWIKNIYIYIYIDIYIYIYAVGYMHPSYMHA
jgi:hypothetical protein